MTGTPSTRADRSDTLLAGAVILASVIWSVLTYGGTASPDLMASWLAAEAFSAGAFDQIYPADTHVYTMTVPDTWISSLAAKGYADDIYPFVYPPLWAALIAPLTETTSFETFQSFALWLNPLWLGLTVLLAGRMIPSSLPLWAFTALGLVLLHFTLVGIVALDQDQPQILVSFLIVLGLERSRFGQPIWGGIAMALAAAIKLYPLFFALAWLVRGERQAVASFVIAGALFGAASVALAGWPLHALFLKEVQIIGATAFANPFVWSLDPLIAQIFNAEAFTLIIPESDPEAAWSVWEKPSLWRWINIAALLGAVACVARMRSPLVWPLLALAIGLLSPLSWGYHYITAVAFAPALFALLGMRAGGGILLLFFFPLIALALPVIEKIPAPIDALPFVGVTCLGLLGAGFWSAHLRILAAKGAED